MCSGHGVCIGTKRDMSNLSAIVAARRAGAPVGSRECGTGVCICDVWYEGEWCQTHLLTAPRYLPATHPRDMAAACMRSDLFWAARGDLWDMIVEHQLRGAPASFGADTTSALAITLRSFVLALGSALQMPRPPAGPEACSGCRCSAPPCSHARRPGEGRQDQGHGGAGLRMHTDTAGLRMDTDWSYLAYPACPQGLVPSTSTLLPSPCILLPTPSTLHPPPCTLHPTPICTARVCVCTRAARMRARASAHLGAGVCMRELRCN